MQQLVECVPNFSEGRNTEVIDQIVAAMEKVKGVSLLDRHSDEDHNRTVITFVAPPRPAAEAAFAGIAKAAELIDMERHTGEHPRLGATDVVPFVPIAGVSLDDCIELASLLGQRVGDELGIPVYLYEAAATRPERANLANVRRGEYEALKDAIQTDPDRAPDYGPAELGSAGATVIGARLPLIAFNVYLTTEDVSVAKKIAKAVRHSSGGLRFVKSVGLLVEGRAQVSMNLTDYSRTPIARVVEFIRREAARYGVAVHHSELVGLAPQEALLDAAGWYLQLDDFEMDQVLETRLLGLTSQAAAREDDFLERLAEGTPTPGGGSAAAHVAATGAALVGMVARLTIGKEKYQAVEKRMKEVAREADDLRAWFEEAVARDAEAFDGVMQALRMPKTSEQEKAARSEALARATEHAAAVPLEVCGRCSALLELALEVVDSGNLNAATDAAAAGSLAYASLISAGLNVRVNADSAADKGAAKAWLEELNGIEIRAADLRDQLRETLQSRAGLELPE